MISQPIHQDAVPQQDRLLVTIDGPAGTGKSSVSRQLAKKLGVDFLDTGAMYRAVAALAIDTGIDISTLSDDESNIARMVNCADLQFDFSTDPPNLCAAGKSIMTRLRDPDVAVLVSPISKLPAIRRILVQRQRRIAEVHPQLVSEGRDQGSIVFPGADVKFYLDASLDVRARRRVQQLSSAGRPADLEQIKAEIADRDKRDSTRNVGPLICPEDAIRVDTSDLSRDGVVQHLHDIVLQHLTPASAGA